jgi:hypothetical protein
LLPKKKLVGPEEKSLGPRLASLCAIKYCTCGAGRILHHSSAIRKGGPDMFRRAAQALAQGACRRQGQADQLAAGLGATQQMEQ